MEAVEEHITNTAGIDIVKSNIIENEDELSAVAANLCHKSNGVAEMEEAGQPIAGGNEVSPLSQTAIVQNSVVHTEITDSIEPNEIDVSSEKDNFPNEIDKTAITETSQDIQPKDEDTLDVTEVVTEVIIDHETDKSICHDIEITKVAVTETPSDDTPKFRTEILIEANDNVADAAENSLTDADDHDAPNNLLSEFGESIELSDVLRSDITINSENNNCSVRQEVFNKEELLDILEGNDVNQTSEPVSDKPHSLAASIETKLALQQLSRLNNQKRRCRIPSRTAKVKKDIKESVEKDKFDCNEAEEQVEKKKSNQIQPEKSLDGCKDSNFDDKSNLEKKKSIAGQSNKNVENEEHSNKGDNSTKKKKVSKDDTPAGNIVNVLVMDWDDEEQEPDPPKESIAESEDLLNETDTVIKKEDDIEDRPLVQSLNDSVSNEDSALKLKTRDENQPQRRLGRVIKKKVIFDPDNPDTFTKSKTKNRESVKEHVEKETPPFKKGKLEHTPQRSKSKSPMLNLQWKKPSSKNSKQNKRLTEVDKLLMDEGAVNMIYQLTPEAPKGKKSRETKAEFIKKLQSSTPDGKEMKFRERKKENLKYDDGDAKKILGAKHRVSLNSSIKSPSVSEDFETHSADDSIIYRRHSSSSYSSSCMSPRRLSDVDSCSVPGNTRSSQLLSENQSPSGPTVANTDQVTDVFMSENANKSSSEIINKDDYLSIREKLNSKLSLALNKRKRESTKNEKPSKLKKVGRSDDKNDTLTKSLGEFKYVTIKINQRLAEICIEKIGFRYNIEVLKEIQQALAFVNSIKDTSVTLLTSECGTLCSSLDIKHIIEGDKTQRTNSALEVAETIRSLLIAVDKHSKLLCAGVQARCSGVGLALAALSDVLLASESATFALAHDSDPPQPGIGALTARCRLPQSMVNDLVLFGRQLSASEALQGGLVSKVLWPNRFSEQVYTIAKDIAAESLQNVMLKKQLINLKKTEENVQTFLSYLDAERDVFVEYWTSVEGQELLRAADSAV